MSWASGSRRSIRPGHQIDRPRSKKELPLNEDQAGSSTVRAEPTSGVHGEAADMGGISLVGRAGPVGVAAFDFIRSKCRSSNRTHSAVTTQ